MSIKTCLNILAHLPIYIAALKEYFLINLKRLHNPRVPLLPNFIVEKWNSII